MYSQKEGHATSHTSHMSHGTTLLVFTWGLTCQQSEPSLLFNATRLNRMLYKESA
jgi:hypothetical protein